MGFKLIGEGFVLIAQLSYGISTVLINLFSRKVSPVVLSGTQFTMGGIVLMLIGAEWVDIWKMLLQGVW